MSVDAIQQIIEAEKQAEAILQETNQMIALEQSENKRRLEVFCAELKEQEQIEQQVLKEKMALEFSAIKEPLVRQANEELARLQTISPELRTKAMQRILTEVVT
ncbi:hypothetical protein [Enterococcus lemanii]|uniref:V-type ATP synthase subunit G n=1 Tax=Enterococcus lemanii TaxID=1159752 RepID=A0ABV9MWK0_9ENTE|nr:hypothetical protein [Enterococcus lemanii]MBM7710319.1 hypothetical protein [Enterococcus lemanii]